MTVGPILAHLRAATKAAHDRLDGKLDVIGRFSDPARRAGLISQYGDFYSAADAALSPWLETIAGLGFEHRSFFPAGSCAQFPAIASKGEALGALYVVEGSALGGRIILRELAAKGVPTEGLEFLDPHGAATGEVWRGFLAILEDEGRGRGDEVQRGAMSAFHFAEYTLCEKVSA